MPGIGMDNPPAPPTRFVKLVNKGVSRVEAVLKTILAPQEPVASIVENFLLLFPEATLGSFYVVLDLKGLKKSEQAPLVEIFKQRASSAACQNTHRALSLTSSTTAALLRGTPADTPTGSAANATLPRNTTPHSEGLPPLSPSDSLPPSLTPASPRPTHLTEHSRWTRPFSPEATYRPALQGTAPSANSLTSPSLPSSSSNRLNHNLRRLMSGMSIRKGGGEGKSF
ncbi:Vacuolar protein sorting-associated protein 53 [Dispira parvispora]|uniref:Vacuolar protein sorting-associated protein 53 n=1 Tax=Dispira parvispora TaxID=1520584 RepID=A0A9W8E1K1_9FUNG|nr:Vacuolar protein sorting-associated protein 53 [Dispira parvispora]